MPASTKNEVDSTSDKEKIAEFLLQQFDTAYRMNAFLQEFVWPRYKSREVTRRPGAKTLEGWFWPGTLARVTLREYERCAVGTVMSKRNEDGTYTPHRKLRKYGFAVSGPPQSAP